MKNLLNLRSDIWRAGTVVTASRYVNRPHQVWLRDRQASNWCIVNHERHADWRHQWLNVNSVRRRFVTTSFFFVTAGVYSRSFCWFFVVTTVNVFLLSPVYTIQPVVKPIVKPVWQPVECLYTRYNRFKPVSQPVGCLFTRYRRYRLDNRLYHVNGVLVNKMMLFVTGWIFFSTCFKWLSLARQFAALSSWHSEFWARTFNKVL